MPDKLKIAQVLKPQGIKGELKLKAFTDNVERFYDLEYVYIDGKKVQIHAARMYKQFVYIKIEGCPDRNTAETLRGKFLYVDRENAAPLPPGAMFIVDMIGKDVVDEAGAKLGVLADVIQTGGVDVYVVKAEKGFMFPAVAHVVLHKGENIVVDAQELQKVCVYD